MNSKFYKIKTTHLIGAVLGSICIGVAAGLAVTGIVLLALKLSGCRGWSECRLAQTHR